MYDAISLYKLAAAHQAQAQLSPQERLRRALGRQFVRNLALHQRLAESELPRFGMSVGAGIGSGLLGAGSLAALSRRFRGRQLLPTLGLGATLGAGLGVAKGIRDYSKRRQIERALARNMLQNYIWQYKL